MEHEQVEFLLDLRPQRPGLLAPHRGREEHALLLRPDQRLGSRHARVSTRSEQSHQERVVDGRAADPSCFPMSTRAPVLKG